MPEKIRIDTSNQINGVMIGYQEAQRLAQAWRKYGVTSYWLRDYQDGFNHGWMHYCRNVERTDCASKRAQRADAQSRYP